MPSVARVPEPAAATAFCAHDDVSLAGARTGKLAGTTFAAKCLFAVAGARSCFGNPTWLATHAPASRTASAIATLVDAGATLAGFTVTDELALSLTGENAHFGAPVNPRAPGRVAGGSSSGSASAVASGAVDFALGTDTGGSVRVPASHTGVFGFRPTHGAVPLDGVLALAPSFDTVGWFARDGALLEQVGDVLLPPVSRSPPGLRGAPDGAPADSSRACSRPSRLVALRSLEASMDPNAWVAFASAAAGLARALGAELVFGDVDEPTADTWCDTYLTLQNLEARAVHAGFLRDAAPVFGSLIARRFGWVLAAEPAERAVAEAHRDALARAVASLTDGDAWLVVPSAPGAAPRLGLSDDATDAFTGRGLTLNALASLLGLPAVSLPFAITEACPLGVCLVGAAGSDRALLRAAATVRLEETI